MKSWTLLAVAAFLSLNVLAQKVKIKDGVAQVDGSEYVQYDKSAIEATIKPLGSDEEVVFISWLDYEDRNKVTKSNPQGKVRWVELNFLSLGIKCEINSRGHKGVVKLLYENKVFEGGVFNPEQAQKVVQKYGMRFSEGRPNGTTIIINK